MDYSFINMEKGVSIVNGRESDYYDIPL